MRAATLNERKAFLIVLLGKNEEYHGSYIREKVQFALDEHTSPDLLYGALDSDNQYLYNTSLGYVK